MTANGDLFGRWLVRLLCCAGPLLHPLCACCGNLEMVEKSVEELDAVNREALSHVEGLPRNGTIDLKAYITMEGDKPTVRLDESATTVKGSGPSARKGEQLPRVDVSATPVDGKIDFVERSGPATKGTPGGSDDP